MLLYIIPISYFIFVLIFYKYVHARICLLNSYWVLCSKLYCWSRQMTKSLQNTLQKFQIYRKWLNFGTTNIVWQMQVWAFVNYHVIKSANWNKWTRVNFSTSNKRSERSECNFWSLKNLRVLIHSIIAWKIMWLLVNNIHTIIISITLFYNFLDNSHALLTIT